MGISRRSLKLGLFIALMGVACSAADDPPPDPPGTVTTQIFLEGNGVNSLTFASGIVTEGGGDLTIDVAGNFVATDQIADVGAVNGLGSITEIPAVGFLVSLAPASGHGFVVKSTESKAYAVVVDGELVSASNGALVGYLLKWAPLPSVTLTVAATGDGFGVISSDSGLSCAGDHFDPPPAWVCADPFNPGTVVTLTAAPRRTEHTSDASCGVDSVYDGWSGIPCDGTGPCTLTLDTDTTVQPAFRRMVSVSVDKQGTGTGTVSSAGSEINCGATCNAQFPTGTTVTLTATPDNVFTGWWATGVPNQPTLTCGNGSGSGNLAMFRRVCTADGTGSCTLTLDATLGITAIAQSHFD